MKIQAIKGMKDIVPDSSLAWQKVERVCSEILMQFSYREIRTPLLEKTALFLRSVGDESDIVNKEMYSFLDRNGDDISLRPEGTASCVRAGIEHGLFYNTTQKLWYMGAMFRHERPQKGRYRQFHQLGAECFGWRSADIEAQMLLLISVLLDALGVRNTQLQINSIGDGACREAYQTALVSYLQDYRDDLDEDSVRRLQTNPLRILDSKNAAVQEVLKNAPNIQDFLSEESQAHFVQLQNYLESLDIAFEINTQLVRGLDYYNDTVFEWVNQDFGAQATVCAGGRYDGLVEQLGGKATPAFGFAMGMERLVQILQEQDADIIQAQDKVQIYIASQGSLARLQALQIQKSLILKGVSVELFCGESSFKSQFKKADKLGADITLIIGEQESLENTVGIKMMKNNAGQVTISQSELIEQVINLLNTL